MKIRFLRLPVVVAVAAATLCPVGSRPVAAQEARVAGKPRLPRWRDTSGMVFMRGGVFVYRGQKVRVRSFYMDPWEVTNAEYCRFLNDGNGDHWNPDQEIVKRGDKFVVKAGRERWPVYAVSWYDASACARWARKRLPTDAEWLWAAAGNEGRTFAWGNAPITPERANFGMNVGHPQPVGSHPAGRSPAGLYDLTGNVAEWCDDGFELAATGAWKRVAPSDKGPRKIRRAGCFAMPAERQGNSEFGMPTPDYHPKCIGFRCVRPARRVLVLVPENFAELEYAAYTAVLSWAGHTNPDGDYMMPKRGAPSVPLIEVVVAGFHPEVHGMGGTTVRPHVLVQDLTDDEIDGFDAVAVPSCVGSGRGQHTDRGWDELGHSRTAAILRRVHAGGGIISTMCGGRAALEAAKLPAPKTGSDRPVAFDPEARTATSVGPAVAVEAASMLVKQLVRDEEYRSFRKYNPWLFGGKDQFPPRMESLR